MKTIFSMFGVLIALTFLSCNEKNIEKNATGNYRIEQWNVIEISLGSSKTYTDPFNQVEVTATFSGPNGKKIILPAFWDGDSVWKVRFAPTAPGEWNMETACNDVDNTGLHAISKSIICKLYRGPLDIFKHGFLKTIKGKRYFVYDDGTPFFYLGDTHWSMPAEPYDTSAISGITSQFKYIADKRVEQGFTVYQSEPIGVKYNLSDGLTSKDLDGFKDLDRRFKYIAEKGLVHANAQLFFASELGVNGSKYPDNYLEKLCRYWVARYASYPVLWTTAQEVDNDFYHGRIINDKDMNPYYDANTNPWKKVAAYVNKYDPYKHPQTAHQEFSATSGDGAAASNSSFRDLPGHSWYGAQWSPAKNAQLDFNIPKDFWVNGQSKPVVNYEGLYDHLWTLEFGARMQGWTAYLNGVCGIGYGAEDIWLYNSTYDIDKPTTRDGIAITTTDKQIKWYDSVNLNSANQMGYMRNFFNSFDWWNLTPRFDNVDWFRNDSSFYSVASKGSDIYVAYFYNTTKSTGTLKGLANTHYSAQWYNPITGIYNTSTNVNISNSSYTIGEKPDSNDWILLMEKIK